MFGVVRTVEFNEASNQSLLHFECIHLEPAMKNEVLSYVYNMLPEREKEVYEALKLTDTDEEESENQEAAAQPEQGNEPKINLPDMPETLSDKTIEAEVHEAVGKKPVARDEEDIDPSINIFD
jgi:hypothetical protein